MERRRRIVFTITIVLVILIFVHPYIFGLPGRIEELGFITGVHSGMTQSELIERANKFGGQGPFGFAVGNLPDEVRPGTVVFQFVDSVSVCIGGGNRYIFHFTPNGRLETWKRIRWESAC